jgi:hypothetical protein
MMTREYVDDPAARELAVGQHGNRLIEVRDRLISLSIVVSPERGVADCD